MRLLTDSTRTPTASEVGKERSIIITTIADLGIISLMAVFFVVSGSMTLLSELIRSILMTAIEIYSLWLLRGVHRGRLTHFEFGIGKVEQFAWLIFGLGLLTSGFWVASHVFQSVTGPEPVVTPMGLAFAAIVNAINLVINGLSFYAFIQASGDNDSDIFRAQMRTRGIKFGNSLLLQVLLTVAALSTDPLVALLLDSVGAMFVAGVMVVSGVAMVAASLPALLDAPLPDDVIASIRQAMANEPGLDALIHAIRSRRSGRFPHVEVVVRRDAGTSAEEIDAAIIRIRGALQEAHTDIDLSVSILPGAAT